MNFESVLKQANNSTNEDAKLFDIPLPLMISKKEAWVILTPNFFDQTTWNVKYSKLTDCVTCNYKMTTDMLNKYDFFVICRFLMDDIVKNHEKTQKFDGYFKIVYHFAEGVESRLLPVYFMKI